jgi:hypothetical protein
MKLEEQRKLNKQSRKWQLVVVCIILLFLAYATQIIFAVLDKQIDLQLGIVSTGCLAIFAGYLGVNTWQKSFYQNKPTPSIPPEEEGK